MDRHLTTLPTEIRCLIYSLVLTNPHPILIISPLSKIGDSGYPCCTMTRGLPENFTALTLVSKDVRADAAAIIYSVNTFEISTSRFISCNHKANLLGFNTFQKRTPKAHLALIRRVNFEMDIETEQQQGFYWRPEKTSLRNAENVALSLSKTFQGLESLYVIMPQCEDIRLERRELFGASWGNFGSPISGLIRLILRIETLKEMRCNQRDMLGKLPELLERTIGERNGNVRLVVEKSKKQGEFQHCSI